MTQPTKRTKPSLWERVKAKVMRGAKGGEPGEWSARKAQLAVHDYKAEGGGYVGARDPHNHLKEWTDEDWGTKSGKPSGETHERYLPKAAREHLTEAEYARTTAKKRADTKRGRQFSAQPEDVAEKTATYRHGGEEDAARATTKAELYAKAKAKGIEGRSRMSKAELAKAVGA